MLLVLALLLLTGLVLTIDRPQLPVRSNSLSSSTVEPGAPRPPEPTRPLRDRPRAHVEERQDDTSRTRCGAAIETAPAPAVACGLTHASPRPADPSPEPLFRTFCALLC